ncbi:tail fiber domain-containing protein [Humibacter ginsenosidimutans]|uniref:Tail fiber domain-containing protein n=1 Tax=Humibacter ginsenosidimutans TaxID=2599293 RepID=A0A5B8M1Y2_9MICO|nr:tail fiber domain-containing protein [Humibacter ginsenosidimutans]QDZ14758.1 tail fiber domain-containing protein [Humibacter ginsenosidimutans]
MAHGDAAAADGMAVVSGTADRRQGYDEINLTRDYVAGRLRTDFSNIAGGAVPVTAGGTGATNAADALTALGAQPALGYTPVKTGSANNIQLKWSGTQVQCVVDATTFPLQLAGHAIDTNGGTINTDGGNLSVAGGILISTGGRNSQVSSNYVAAYFNGDGTLRASASVRSSKQNIQPVVYPLDLLQRIGPVKFRYKSAVAELGDDAPTEVGFIADDFVDAGIPEFTYTNADGDLQGLHYEKIVAALWSIVQQQQARIAALEAKVQ